MTRIQSARRALLGELFVALLALNNFLHESHAFAFVVPSSRFSGSTRLHLVPEQGSQLVAAFNAACTKPEEDDEDDYDYEPVPHITNTTAEIPPSPLSAARAFVSRVFSLPSSLLHPAELIEDVVLYPITGFRLQSQHAFPTVANASCRILPQNQELYGWYSPACRIDEKTQRNDEV